MKYRTQILGPLFTATGGLIVSHAAGYTTLLESLTGITAASTLTIAILLFKWADVE